MKKGAANPQSHAAKFPLVRWSCARAKGVRGMSLDVTLPKFASGVAKLVLAVAEMTWGCHLFPIILTLPSMARNRIIPYRKDLKNRARELRKNSTLSEVLLWCEIKNRQLKGYQFHRQVPMLDYIVDFYCHELMLAIEIDGESHDSELAIAKDRKRQKRLEEEGVKFLRFDDLDVKQSINYVLEDIISWIEDRESKQI